jgi:prepilin-type N-terminal cleavage/methylation domain-containing protein
MKRSAKKGFTLVEIMIVVAIIALLAAIAIPNVLRGRATANESAAIGNLRALLSSLEMFRSVNNVYPATNTWLASMYGANCAPGTAPNPDFGPPSFCIDITGAGGVVQGFTYIYAGAAAPANTYTLNAFPQAVGTTGTRAFFADQTGLLRHCTAAAAADRADVNDPTIDAAPVAC